MSTYTNSYGSHSVKSIGLVLNETGVYFEGVKRPLGVLVVRDAPPEENLHSKEGVVLEQYFNDIYSLFLSRLTNLVVSNQISEAESDKIKGLLNEIIKVKGLIGGQN